MIRGSIAMLAYVIDPLSPHSPGEAFAGWIVAALFFAMLSVG